MKHLKNIHTRKFIVCMICIVIMAMLLPVVALAGGFCSYWLPETGIACGRDTTRRVVATSAEQHGVQWYYSEHFQEDARFDYKFREITEADVCAAGHYTNVYTYTQEYDHACQNAGR